MRVSPNDSDLGSYSPNLYAAKACQPPLTDHRSQITNYCQARSSAFLGVDHDHHSPVRLLAPDLGVAVGLRRSHIQIRLD